MSRCEELEMLARWVLASGIVLASLMYGNAAQAEGNCPPGYFPVGGGNGGWAGCAPITPSSGGPAPGSGSAPHPSPGKLKYGYGKDYGYGHTAIATHPKAKDVWATWNQRTEKKANQTVLKACTQTMGAGCVILSNSQNGAVAIVRDSNNEFWPGRRENDVKAAQASAMRLCQSYSKGKGCEVLHTFTSEPSG